MAGKRQHYIPQFLLDGFAAQGKGAGSFVWVYRKEALPLKINIINAAVEQHFFIAYSNMRTLTSTTNTINKRTMSRTGPNREVINEDVVAADIKLFEAPSL